MANPLVSIITPTFNCRRDLQLTLESIRAQGDSDFELIVIDGGSTDGTMDVVEENRDLIGYAISEPDQGIYDAMNKGMLQGRGFYLQFLNAGDLLYSPDTLAKVCQSLSTRRPDVLFGRFVVTDQNYEMLFDITPKEFSSYNLRTYGTGTVNHQAMFVRRKLSPLYSPRYRLKGELNWYVDIVEKNPGIHCEYVDFPIVKYKVGGAGNLAYRRNLFEWICLVQRRFGTWQNLRNIPRYKNFLKYIKNIKRYYD